MKTNFLGPKKIKKLKLKRLKIQHSRSMDLPKEFRANSSSVVTDFHFNIYQP